MRAPRTVLTLAAVALLLSACEDDREPPPRPMAGRGAPSSTATGAGTEGRASEAARGERVHPSEVGGGGGSAAGEGPQAATAGAPVEAEHEREGPDLEAAVRDVLHAGEPCLPEPSELSDPPDSLTVRATVHLSATGVVTRASASSASLPEDSVRCFERRLERHDFRSPGEASRRVSAEMKWRFEREEPETVEKRPEKKPPTSGFWIGQQ